MSVPSMVHRSGDALVVRSVVSGDALYGTDHHRDDEHDEAVVEDKDLPECKIKRNYSCSNCDYFTQNPRNFLYHLRDVHKEKVRIYECPNCLYASKHYQKLLRHAKMVHGTAEGIELPRGKKRQIEESDQDDQNDSDGDDEEKTTAAGQFRCAACQFSCKTQAQLAKHDRDEHSPKIKAKFFKCTKCSYTTPIKARFTKHTKYHSMPMIKCDLCDFKTPYKWNLDRHCKNHNGAGAYRCSSCNFTADIKQSLTVHEMNHHVPPVGQAAGIGVGKRRNKVGASDTISEDGPAAQSEPADATVDPKGRNAKTTTTTTLPQQHHHHHHHQQQQPPSKKAKPNSGNEQRNAYGSDFINPDDIIHHANGQIYIKNKCKLCNYKSAWDGEMAKHEEKVHNIIRNNNNNYNSISGGFKTQKKKTSKPIPNLIPLNHQLPKIPVPQQFCQPSNMNTSPFSASEPVYSQKDFNDICAKSLNSDLKDFASLIDDSDVFKNVEKLQHKIPDLIPTSSFTSKKIRGTSFFDKFKANLTTDNLRCEVCGHESKCLTEFDSHKKICGGKIRAHNPSPIPRHNLSSTRCQFCRQRCKSSTDLVNHLQTCPEAVKSLRESEELSEVKSEEIHDDPHPMENKVFVWNDIQVPMDVDLNETNDDVQYELIEEKQDDNISLDLSIRTQSPNSENSYLSIEPTPTPTPPAVAPVTTTTPTTTTEKIPTHGNDISIAQHKRVFKCPHCTFWASTASRFHVHIVGHLNKKPFECSLCSYRSNWRWDITKHIKLKSVRDPAHETAKVLMTDETGRRNYTKYNKYLTEINVSSDHNETSGGSGTRPRNHESPSQVASTKAEIPRVGRTPNSGDFSPLLRSPRPVPGLKAAADLTKVAAEKKRNTSDSKKSLWQCKKCNFRDPSREKLLAHVRNHYSSSTPNGGQQPSNQEIDEASVGGGYSRGQAPFRCGHCQQVSNWKHVIQRHCRLKHSGDIKVVIGNKNGPDRIEVEEQPDDGELVDVPQTGLHKCVQCPYSTNNPEELEKHSEGHFPRESNVTRCALCNFHVANRSELLNHLTLHGITDPDEYLSKQDGEATKRYQCTMCPYDTNSKSQFSYHKQFHVSQGHQYTCKICGYNVSKRHLLHQHMKVHNIRGNEDVIDLEEGSDEIEEVTQASSIDSLSDIPQVWVSKDSKYSKMYKCRYCPHVNSRKVNIQEHEKMHGARERSIGSKNSDIEHRCPDCTYVCNNAGVLSSHSKVHQGLYGKIHGIVDPKRSDDSQIKEMSESYSSSGYEQMDSDDEGSDLVIDCGEEGNTEQMATESVLYFCDKCPARFLKEQEFLIHLKFHGARLIYKCDHCTYTARQGPHILAHNNIHSEEYQKRTAIFKGTYCAHPDYRPPIVVRKELGNNEVVYIVNENGDFVKSLASDMETEPECSIASNKAMKLTYNIPLSGTDLFQQKNEAQLKQRSNLDLSKDVSSSSRTDPQFGSQMHGNPDFVYPTCVKNGKTKEKRYKCHKCPSAFEKREQYKVHLGLHGAKNKFSCDHCDYSVKYYANFAQHIKKHKLNDEAVSKKTPKSEIDDEEIEIERKLYHCTNCPYVTVRRDALDNHMRKHSGISGTTSAHQCEHCDYSVPQAHFLRDHTKLHFASPKSAQPEGFMVCDGIKISSRLIGEDDEVMDDERLVFEDRGRNASEERFEPPLDGQVTNSNNNKGERVYVSPGTGEFLDSPKASTASGGAFAVDLSRVPAAAEGNIDSQVSSDN